MFRRMSRLPYWVVQYQEAINLSLEKADPSYNARRRYQKLAHGYVLKRIYGTVRTQISTANSQSPLRPQHRILARVAQYKTGSLNPLTKLVYVSLFKGYGALVVFSILD